MATLTGPDDTGTLDRDAVQRAAQATDTEVPSVDDLDERAGHLRGWLESRGVDVDSPREPRGGEGSEPARAGTTADTQPFTQRARAVAEEAVGDLRALLERLTEDLTRLGKRGETDVEPAATSEASASEASTSPADIAPSAPVWEDERPGLGERSRWALVVAAWAAAVALLLPLLLYGVVSAFDMTVDLDAPAPVDGGTAPSAQVDSEAGT